MLLPQLMVIGYSGQSNSSSQTYTIWPGIYSPFTPRIFGDCKSISTTQSSLLMSCTPPPVPNLYIQQQLNHQNMSAMTQSYIEKQGCRRWTEVREHCSLWCSCVTNLHIRQDIVLMDELWLASQTVSNPVNSGGVCIHLLQLIPQLQMLNCITSTGWGGGITLTMLPSPSMC